MTIGKCNLRLIHVYKMHAYYCEAHLDHCQKIEIIFSNIRDIIYIIREKKRGNDRDTLGILYTLFMVLEIYFSVIA